MTDRPVVLAVDIGGTSLKGAVVSAEGRLLWQESRVVSGLQGEPIFTLLTELLDSLGEWARRQTLVPLAGAVICPGLNERTGEVMFASNLGWRALALQARLERHLGLPVAAAHDVRSAGLAEARFGAARGISDFAMVMLGTGIAAALVVNGQAAAGAGCMGGEVGHVPVVPGGELCPCGQRGCLEVYASAGGLVRRFRAGGGDPVLTAAEIVQAAPAGGVAARVWADAVAALGLGLVTLTMLLDPALILLGGGLAEAGAALLDPTRDALRAGLAWRDPPVLAQAKLGATGAVLGAAALGFERMGMGDAVMLWQPSSPSPGQPAGMDPQPVARAASDQ
jgi:glucokinase